MTSKETKEILESLLGFFNLKAPTNEITLQMVEKGIENRIYSIAIDAILLLGEASARSDSKINPKNYSDALKVFGEFYKIAYEQKVKETNDKYTPVANLPKPEDNIPAELKVMYSQKNPEKAGFFICAELCRYKLIKKSSEEFKLFGNSKFANRHKEEINTWLAKRESVGTMEAAKFINDLIEKESNPPQETVAEFLQNVEISNHEEENLF